MTSSKLSENPPPRTERSSCPDYHSSTTATTASFSTTDYAQTNFEESQDTIAELSQLDAGSFPLHGCFDVSGDAASEGLVLMAPGKRKQVKVACVNCRKSCKRCDDQRPCTRCVRLNITDSCIDWMRKVRGRGYKRGPYRKKESDDRSSSEVSKFDRQSDPSPVLTLSERYQRLTAEAISAMSIYPSINEIIADPNWRPVIVRPSPPTVNESHVAHPIPSSGNFAPAPMPSASYPIQSLPMIYPQHVQPDFNSDSGSSAPDLEYGPEFHQLTATSSSSLVTSPIASSQGAQISNPFAHLFHNKKKEISVPSVVISTYPRNMTKSVNRNTQPAPQDNVDLSQFFSTPMHDPNAENWYGHLAETSSSHAPRFPQTQPGNNNYPFQYEENLTWPFRMKYYE